MNWQKLDKESLETLKQENTHILVCSENEEFPYDVIRYLDLRECGLNDDKMEYHWSNLINVNYEYDDKDLLHLFSYFCILNQPERSKREDSQKCEMRCSEHCSNAVRDK